jgi:hypothetical protein
VDVPIKKLRLGTSIRKARRDGLMQDNGLTLRQQVQELRLKNTVMNKERRRVEKSKMSDKTSIILSDLDKNGEPGK